MSVFDNSYLAKRKKKLGTQKEINSARKIFCWRSFDSKLKNFFLPSMKSSHIFSYTESV